VIPEHDGAWRTTTSAECEHWLDASVAAVRPPGAPVPSHLVGHPAGDVFARLVRMNDGPLHAALKPATVAAFDALAPEHIAEAADAAATYLVRNATGDLAATVEAWVSGFAPLATAALCGIDVSIAGSDVIESAAQLAAAFGPGSSAADTAAANRAAATLGALVGGAADSAALRLTHTGDASPSVARANVLGWFFQSYDACAALIGSSLATLLGAAATGAAPCGMDVAGIDDSDIDAAIRVTLSDTPPIHTTRRYVTASSTTDPPGPWRGDVVMVSLGPGEGPGHPFGWGAHRCPAERIAPQLARHALTGLLAHEPGLGRLRVVGWRPSPNARIPELGVARSSP
jgi:hypothetical protein